MNEQRLIIDIPRMAYEYLSIMIEFGLISHDEDHLELDNLFKNLAAYSYNEVSLDAISDMADSERFYNPMYNDEKLYIHDVMDKAIMELITLVNNLHNDGYHFKDVTVHRILGDTMLISLQ